MDEQKQILDAIAGELHEWPEETRNCYASSELPSMVKAVQTELREVKTLLGRLCHRVGVTVEMIAEESRRVVAERVAIIFVMLFASTGCAADWTLQPLRPPRDGSVYADIEAHCQNPRTYYTGHGLPDDAHEMTHGINGDNRDHINGPLPENVRVGINCFYVLNNQLVVLHEPNCTMADFIRRCPWHGALWNLEIVWKTRVGWQNQPLHILDELTAYTHAAMVGAQIGDRDYIYDVKSAREMSYYAWQLVAVIEAVDPHYSDLQSLKAFIKWNDARIGAIR